MVMVWVSYGPHSHFPLFWVSFDAAKVQQKNDISKFLSLKMSFLFIFGLYSANCPVLLAVQQFATKNAGQEAKDSKSRAGDQYQL